MALLSDNKTVVIAFRPNTDSMCPGGPVPFKYTWSQPTPIEGVGCVRPRMVRLAAGPLLMTGGRLCPDVVPNASFAGHGCLPQGGNGQGGIFVWLNSDGMADAPPGTAKRGREWHTYCLGAIHNQGTHNSGQSLKNLFTNCSKAGLCRSQTYNSLVPLGAASAAVFYQNGYAGSSASTWMMRMDVFKEVKKALNRTALKADDEQAQSAPTATAWDVAISRRPYISEAEGQLLLQLAPTVGAASLVVSAQLPTAKAAWNWTVAAKPGTTQYVLPFALDSLPLLVHNDMIINVSSSAPGVSGSLRRRFARAFNTTATNTVQVNHATRGLLVDGEPWALMGW